MAYFRHGTVFFFSRGSLWELKSVFLWMIGQRGHLRPYKTKPSSQSSLDRFVQVTSVERQAPKVVQKRKIMQQTCIEQALNAAEKKQCLDDRPVPGAIRVPITKTIGKELLQTFQRQMYDYEIEEDLLQYDCPVTRQRLGGLSPDDYKGQFQKDNCTSSSSFQESVFEELKSPTDILAAKTTKSTNRNMRESFASMELRIQLEKDEKREPWMKRVAKKQQEEEIPSPLPQNTSLSKYYRITSPIERLQKGLEKAKRFPRAVLPEHFRKKYEECKQSSDIWHLGRMLGIGASEVGAYFGFSHYEDCTPIKTWTYAAGIVHRQQLKMAFCRHGHAVEDEARKFAKPLLGLEKDIEESGITFDKLRAGFQASLDGICTWPYPHPVHNRFAQHLIGKGYELSIMEIKSPIYRTILRRMLEHAPFLIKDEHSMQIMYQMIVSGIIHALYVVEWRANPMQGPVLDSPDHWIRKDVAAQNIKLIRITIKEEKLFSSSTFKGFPEQNPELHEEQIEIEELEAGKFYPPPEGVKRFLVGVHAITGTEGVRSNLDAMTARLLLIIRSLNDFRDAREALLATAMKREITHEEVDALYEKHLANAKELLSVKINFAPLTLIPQKMSFIWMEVDEEEMKKHVEAGYSPDSCPSDENGNFLGKMCIEVWDPWNLEPSSFTPSQLSKI